MNIDATTGSLFGKPNKVIHISSVHCDGSETSIDQFFKKRYTLEEGKRLISNIEVAGVVCHYQSTATSTSIAPTPNSIKGTNNKTSSTITALAVLVSILLIIVVMMRFA